MVKKLIEAQAAIDAVLSVLPYDEYWAEQVKAAINRLPAAQTNDSNQKGTIN